MVALYIHDDDCIVHGWLSSSSSLLHFMWIKMMIALYMDDYHHRHYHDCIVYGWWWLHHAWMIVIIIITTAPFTDILNAYKYGAFFQWQTTNRLILGVRWELLKTDRSSSSSSPCPNLKCLGAAGLPTGDIKTGSHESFLFDNCHAWPTRCRQE